MIKPHPWQPASAVRAGQACLPTPSGSPRSTSAPQSFGVLWQPLGHRGGRSWSCVTPHSPLCLWSHVWRVYSAAGSGESADLRQERAALRMKTLLETWAIKLPLWPNSLKLELGLKSDCLTTTKAVINSLNFLYHLQRALTHMHRHAGSRWSSHPP